MSKIFLPWIGNGTGNLKIRYMFSLLEAFEGHPVTPSHFDRGCYVMWSRNAAASYFLEKTDCEYLLFIDLDIVFTKKHIDLLMESDEPIITGLYYLKTPERKACFIPLDGDPEFGGVVPVKRAGTGFMRIHRDVFKRLAIHADAYVMPDTLAKERNYFPVGVRKGEYLSEDWYFCDMAREAGYKIMLDTRIQLLHDGGALYPLPQKEQPTWMSIQGWFTEEDAKCYEEIVKNTPMNGMVAEVGCFKGRSTCCLISLIQAADKNINIHAIDTFKGSEEHQRLAGLDELRKQFEKNVKSTRYPWVYIHASESTRMASGFPKEHFHAVFIDGAHDQESVAADIKAWLPKIRKGGIIAGHDYDYPSVQNAVLNIFHIQDKPIEPIGRCWLVRL